MPSITVGTTPVIIVQKNAKRMTLTLRNESTAGQKIYGWLHEPGGLVITNADYVFSVGEEKSYMVFFDGKDLKNAFSAIADAASGKLYYAETAERE